MTNIKAALTDLFDRELALDNALDRHFAPDYRQRTDGTWSDRAEFADHIAHLRSIIRSADINIIDEHRDGTRYADRHTVDVAKVNGGRVVQEVYLFGQFAADGRFLRVDETTLMLAGEEADRDLGNSR